MTPENKVCRYPDALLVVVAAGSCAGALSAVRVVVPISGASQRLRSQVVGAPTVNHARQEM